jgi:hypothetical protein
MLTGENVAWVFLAGAFEWRSIRSMFDAREEMRQDPKAQDSG